MVTHCIVALAGRRLDRQLLAGDALLLVELNAGGVEAVESRASRSTTR
jgi:hypothetical protein